MLLNAVAGWGDSQLFTYADTKEAEAEQGKNLMLAAGFQAQKLILFSDVTYRLAEEISNPALRVPAEIVCSVFPIFSSLMTLFSAKVKQGEYPKIAQLSKKFPNSLSKEATQRFRFWADNAGKFAQGGMLVGIIALIRFQHNPFSAAAMLAPFIYKMAENRQLVPMRVRLATEKYLTILAQTAITAGGSPLNRVLGVGMLLSYSQQINYLIDDFIRSQRKLEDPTLQGPSLREIDKPHVEQNDLSYEQILAILNASPDDFRLCHSYCSQVEIRLDLFEQNQQFDHYWRYFLDVDWTQYTSCLKKKFQDDNRFQDLCREKFHNYFSGPCRSYR